MDTPQIKGSGQDSTGKLIHVGDRVRFRGENYTIKKFLPNLKIEFIEECHTEEIPKEFTVDRIDQEEKLMAAWHVSGPFADNTFSISNLQTRYGIKIKALSGNSAGPEKLKEMAEQICKMLNRSAATIEPNRKIMGDENMVVVRLTTEEEISRGLLPFGKCPRGYAYLFGPIVPVSGRLLSTRGMKEAIRVQAVSADGSYVDGGFIVGPDQEVPFHPDVRYFVETNPADTPPTHYAL